MAVVWLAILWRSPVIIAKTINGAAFVVGCLLGIGATPAANAQARAAALSTATAEPSQMVTNGPQVIPVDYAAWSVRRNVIESRNYERLLATNPAFRHQRMLFECGPIDDLPIYQHCLASFRQRPREAPDMRARLRLVPSASITARSAGRELE